MLINLSNHPLSTWSELQIEAAKEQFSDIVDLQFPAIDPAADETEIERLADIFLNEIMQISEKLATKPVVHLMGEYSFSYALTNRLKLAGIEVVVSTSMRQSEMNFDGTKTIRFDFVRFRKY